MIAVLALLIALAASTTASASTLPSQVHIALSGHEADGMSIAWYTPSATTTSTVQYGRSSGALTSVATGSASHYLEGHGYHHAVVLEGLGVGQMVQYRVGDASGGWSEVFSFQTAPATNATVKVAVFGDMGYEDSEKRPMILTVHGLVKDWSATYARNTLERLKDDKEIDMTWHVGDIGYTDDAFAHHPASFSYENAYNGYMDWLQNLSATMPYMVSPGNHESECHSPLCVVELKKYGLPLSNFTAFNQRWHMPSVESGAPEGSSMWYSFNYGPIHFVSMNTETDWPGAGEETTGDSHDKKLPAGGFGREGEYLAWLAADLAQADKERHLRPWVVAGGHRPVDELAATAAPLLMKYHVDAYFAGHSHSYSRSRYNNSLLAIVSGGAGCDEMKQGSTTTVDPSTGAVFSDRYSMGYLVANRSSLAWKLLDAANGSVIDTVVLTK